VKCMRGLLTSMMRQRNKVERFKDNYSPCDAIHAKFDVASGTPVRLCSFKTIILIDFYIQIKLHRLAISFVSLKRTIECQVIAYKVRNVVVIEMIIFYCSTVSYVH
jgi:hypothetical protein